MGSLFSTPKVTPPARMPDANDPIARKAAQQQQASILSRSGRTSTMLARDTRGGTAGTGAYRNTVLGQT